MTELSRDDIKAKLDALEIEYDGRLSTEHLAALLPADDGEATHPEPIPVPQPTGERTLPFEVMRDYWPTDRQEDRVRKGTIVEMTAAEALDAVSSGALRKV